MCNTITDLSVLGYVFIAFATVLGPIGRLLAPTTYIVAETSTGTGVARVSLLNSGAWSAHVDVRVNENGTLTDLVDVAIGALELARRRHHVTRECVTMSASDEIVVVLPHAAVEIIGFAPGANASVCTGTTRRAVVVDTLMALRATTISVTHAFGHTDGRLLENRVLSRFMGL